VVADSWKRSIARLLDSLQVAAERRVVFVSHLFEEKALFWWDTVQRLRGAEAGPMLWAEFVLAFDEKFFPSSVRDRMEVQFLALAQGSSSVAEYEAKFSELARYAPHLVDPEHHRAKRFMHGLRPRIRGKLAALEILSYAEACRKALAMELDVEESRDALQPGQGVKRQKLGPGRQRQRQPLQPQPQPQPQRQQPPPQQQRRFIRGAQAGQQPQRAPGACFVCFSPDHQKLQCPVWLAQQPRQQLAIAAPPPQVPQPQRGAQQPQIQQRGPQQQRAGQPPQQRQAQVPRAGVAQGRVRALVAPDGEGTGAAVEGTPSSLFSIFLSFQFLQ
jgi:hypothetical protein